MQVKVVINFVYICKCLQKDSNSTTILNIHYSILIQLIIVIYLSFNTLYSFSDIFPCDFPVLMWCYNYFIRALLSYRYFNYLSFIILQFNKILIILFYLTFVNLQRIQTNINLNLTIVLYTKKFPLHLLTRRSVLKLTICS